MALLDVIEWRDFTGDEIVHRWPASGPGTIKWGAQLTVRESQVAVFFRDGKALDVFQPGRHTLETNNIPLLGALINLPFGGQTPFQAEVYFVNMKTFADMKWGTPAPIIFRDSELHTVSLRSFGAYTMRVREPQLFVNTIVGTEHVYDSDACQAWLRNFIASRFTDTLGEVMDTVLDLPKLYDEIGVAVKARVGEDFERYGLELIDFVIGAITPPDEVMEMINERARMEAVGDMNRFTQFRTAQAIGDLPKAGGDSMAAAGMGMGAGVGMGAAMAEALRGAMSGNQQQAPPAEGATPVSPAGAKFCANCGKPLAAGAKFCSECGAKVGG
ncbi:MAG: SPFH domain-containing protein [Armatimonadetes bacterium]|jgi:membrane protease subunit (stomatin/prohibitin family)|nr:SPFH domain-containing protein [Armatimonadota bacterium]MDI9582741.1 SPFH domain-containing protein [Acidobacteriota bacterium]